MGKKRLESSPSSVAVSWKHLTLVAVVGFVAYVNSLDNEFVYDDRFVIEQNAAVQELHWEELAGGTYWGDLVEAGLYRPATSVSFGVNRALLGSQAPAFHLINNLLHAATCALVYWLSVLVGAPAVAALSVGLLFAVHPVHAEAVNAIVGRADILSLAFSLVALGLFVRARQQKDSSLLRGAGIFAAFLMALFSKESAAFALPVFLLYEISFHKNVRWRGYAPLVAAFVLYAAVRYAALGGLGIAGRQIGLLDNPAAHVAWGERLLTAPVVFLKYLQLLFLPLWLSADYSFNQIPLPRSVLDVRVVAGCLASGGLIVGAWLAWKRKAGATVFAIGALVVPVIGLVHLLFPLGTLLAERLAYLPSIGACLLIGLGYGLLRHRWQRVADVIMMALLLVGCSATWARNRDWQDNQTLFRRTVETSPQSARSHFLLGAALVEAQDFEGAVASFRRGLTIAPGHAQALVSLGQSLAAAGRDGEAEKVLREASAADPSAGLALGLFLYRMARLEESVDVLGRFVGGRPEDQEARGALSRAALEAGRDRARQGDWGQAEVLLRRSYDVSPTAEVANQLGVATALQGDYDTAETWHRRALQHDPGNAEATNYLGVLEERRGDSASAETWYRKALELDPDWVPALLNLGSIEMRDGDLVAAVESYRRAATLDPQSYEAHNSLGIALARAGHRSEAEEAFRRAIELHPELPAARENLAALGES